MNVSLAKCITAFLAVGSTSLIHGPASGTALSSSPEDKEQDKEDYYHYYWNVPPC